MTNDRIDLLLIKIVEDIPDRLHLLLTKLPSGTEAKLASPKQQAFKIALPLRVSLVRYPDNKILASAETKKPFSFTPYEAQTIETYKTQHHLSKEDAVKELIKLSLQDHGSLKEAMRRTRRKPFKQTHTEISVELWNTISWDEKRTDNTAA